MGARMRSASHGFGLLPAVLLLPLLGCQSLGQKHEAKRVPQYGRIDPHQPRELNKIPFPPYIIEPPDELEIAVSPDFPNWGGNTYTVQPEGIIDLGFGGEVYVAGMTLNDAEQRVSEHLIRLAQFQNPKEPRNYRVAVRLATQQSKFYYVLGAVTNPGRVKTTGNETVLDAILQAGLKSNSLPEKAYLSRPHPDGTHEDILKIDWLGIKDRADTLTNYQIMPGDRIVVPGTKPPGLLSTLLGN
jgi:polysaccharide export outer membrane protein